MANYFGPTGLTRAIFAILPQHGHCKLVSFIWYHLDTPSDLVGMEKREFSRTRVPDGALPLRPSPHRGDDPRDIPVIEPGGIESRVRCRMFSGRQKTTKGAPLHLLGDESFHLGLGEFAKQGGGEGGARGRLIDHWTRARSHFDLRVSVYIT